MTQININPYSDFGFNKIFVQNENLLIDFLNSLMPEHHQIEKLEIIDISDEVKKIENIFLNVLCHATNNTRFIVKIQKGNLKQFSECLPVFATFPLANDHGNCVGGYYLADVPALYFIGIMNFELPDGRKNYHDKLVWTYNDGNRIEKSSQMILLQIPRFNLSAEELDTNIQKWLYFLKNLENMTELPQKLNTEVFAKAFKIAKVADLTPQELVEYSVLKL